MKWRARKIDNRNQMFGYMDYQVICSLPEFFDARDWCWEQWGPGIEYEHFRNHMNYTGQTKYWVWDCTKYQGSSINNGKIYLKDEHAMTLFKLRWTED